MALVQNTNARYLSAEPDFEAVHKNESFIPPGTSRRGIRSQKAANGGDISQLGAKRLVLDRRLQLVVPTINVGYFQPEEFDLDMPDAIAAKITLTLDPLQKWDEDMVEVLQSGLVPKEDLSTAEVERIVSQKLDEISDELKVYYQMVAGFINTSAEGNNALRGVILAVGADDLGLDADNRTVAAGTSNEQVPAVSGGDVQAMSIEHLTTVSEQVRNDNAALLKAMSAVLGTAYYQVSPRLAAAFEPFSTAVEMARVARVTEVDDDMVAELINYDGIIAEMVDNGDIEVKAVVEVVRNYNLNYDWLNDLTDQDFTDEELAALSGEAGGGVDATVLRDANVKVGLARAAEGSDWLATVNGGDDDEATEDMYENVGTWTRINIDELEYLGALAKYAIAVPTTRVLRTRSAPAVSLADFATTRMNTINHELVGACSEVIPYTGTMWGGLCLAKSVMLFDAVSDDIVGQIQHSTAHISYMKSGHHATANNIGHTLTKLLDAIDEPHDVSDLPERLAYGTYYGTKPADQRAVALFLRTKYSRNDLSFAIGRRITPHGPGTVSMFLLNMVMDQLEHVNFFDFLKRNDQYTHFKGVFNQYAKTSHLEAPYALFFYGTGKAESVEMKQAVAPMYAYAAAIGAAMPHSTIGDSVSLRRDASASANNSITARLEVESFVRAYRTFLRSMIRKKLEVKAGLRGGMALLEDGADEAA
jgi:hypothetical protein